jgi:hypothetical protein
MIRKMLIGAAMLVMAAAAPAAAQTYDFNVSPGTVVAGQEVTISGEGCAPFATVNITVTQRSTGTVILTATDETDANGEFTYSFAMPADAAPGWYDILATCGDQEFRGEVLVEGSSTAPSGGSTAPIVRTGSDLNGLGLAGAGLITVGGIILIATRSRRHQARA